MQRPTGVFVLLLLVSALRLTSAQDCQCGSIGDSDQRELSERIDNRFYLDVNNPATCNGTITSWRVCYYGPSILSNSGRSYWATYAVYRRTGSGGDERYERVSPMFSAVRATSDLTDNSRVDGPIREDDYECYDDFVDTGDLPVTIQAGDVLGACAFNPINVGNDNRLRLDVIGENQSENNGSVLLEMNDNGCTTEAIPSNILLNQLSKRNNRRLHLFANIAPILIVTTSAPTTSSMATANPCTTTRSPMTIAITNSATNATTLSRPPSSTLSSDNQVTTTESFLQLRLSPVDNCGSWTERNHDQKQSDIKAHIADVINRDCSCDFPVSNIIESVFSCRNSQTKIVFKARLTHTSEIGTETADDLVTLFSSWVKSGPSLTVGGTVLNVDPTCPAEVESLTDEDCDITKLNDTSLQTQDYVITDESSPQTQNISTVLWASIFGVSIVIIMIVAVTLVLISVLCAHRRMKSNISKSQELQATTDESPTPPVYETIPVDGRKSFDHNPAVELNVAYGLVKSQQLDLEPNIAYGQAEFQQLDNATSDDFNTCTFNKEDPTYDYC